MSKYQVILILSSIAISGANPVMGQEDERMKELKRLGVPMHSIQDAPFMIAVMAPDYQPVERFRDFNEAERYYTEILSKYPSEEEAKKTIPEPLLPMYYTLHLWRAFSRNVQGKNDLAIQDAEIAARNPKYSGFSQDVLSLCRYLMLQDRDEARKEIDSLIAKYPDCIGLHRLIKPLDSENNRFFKKLYRKIQKNGQNYPRVLDYLTETSFAVSRWQRRF